MSPSHGLQLFTNCPSVRLSHRVQSFRNRLLQRGSPTGSQALPANLLWRGLLSPWAHSSRQKPAPARPPHGVTASSRHPPAPAWCPFHRLQVDICSTVGLHGLQGDSLPHHGLHHELQGKTLCSGVPSNSSPSFFTDLGVCRVVSLTLSHSSLLTAISPQFFLLLLKYVITIADWLGLGQRRVHLRAGWHWLYQTWGKLLPASPRSHPYSPAPSPLLPKPCTQTHNRWNRLFSGAQ